MPLSHFLTLRSLLLLTTGALLVNAGLFPSQGQSYSEADTPPKVAEMLDCIIQPRFQKDAGVFGIERIVTLPGHHRIAGILTPGDKQETEILQRVSRANRDYSISFLHCAHVPGKLIGSASVPRKTPSGEVSPSLTMMIAQGHPWTYSDSHATAETRQALQRERQEIKDSLQKIAIDALPNLKKGKSAQTTLGRWYVSTRPILASKESCLGCHAGAKKNELLGAVVYAVSSDAAGSSKPIGQAGSPR